MTTKYIHFNSTCSVSFTVVWLDLRTASTVKELIQKTPQENKDYLRVSVTFEFSFHNIKSYDWYQQVTFFIELF